MGKQFSIHSRVLGSIIHATVHRFNRFCSGVYVSLLANPIMEMGEPWDVGRRTGMFMSISAVGALTGPPISGAIRSATGDFKAVGYYAGQFGSFFVGHSSRSMLFFRNRCPRWGWYVVIHTVSYSTGDVWKDMIGTTKECKKLELDQKFSHCSINCSMYYCTSAFRSPSKKVPFTCTRVRCI